MENGKFCPKCGTQADGDAQFCQSCGSAFGGENAAPENAAPQGQANQGQQAQGQAPQGQAQQNNAGNPPFPSTYGVPIVPRSIGLCILLSIITCGIYGIYWFIKINNETNTLTEHPEATTGGVAFLLTLVTCGIYGLYWYYKMGQRWQEHYFKINLQQYGESPILYLLLGLLLPGLGGLINYCLLQNNINKYLMMKNQGTIQ